MEAPASVSALAMAKPKPASSATPATNARLPLRSMLSIRVISRLRSGFTRGKSFAFGSRVVTNQAPAGGRLLLVKPFRVALLLLVAGGSVNAQVADTINKQTPLLVGKDALLLGIFAIGTAAVSPIAMQIPTRL